MRGRHTHALALAVSLAALLPVAPAAADTYQRVLRAYETTGVVPACEFTSTQLDSALKGIDTYGAQYIADFTEAVGTALSQRAGGACSRHLRPRPISGAGLPSAQLPSSPTSPGTGGVPAPLVLLGIITILAAGAAGAARLVRLSGWEPAWAPAWRHAVREAAYRLEGAAGPLEDRLRGSRRSR